jgi:glucose/arabinose dehydrogenase
MKKLTLSLLLLLCVQAVFTQPKLTPHKITLKNGLSFNLNLPEEFEIIPAFEVGGIKRTKLPRIRFFAKAPDGRLFVTDMINRADNTQGKVYILDGWNAQTGKFGKIIPYLTWLRNPNSVQFYTDEAGQDWIYVAETHQLTRRKFTRGETKPTDTNPQKLAEFPDKENIVKYKYGGWHLSRTIAFSPERKLYVSVGSSCNACVEGTKGLEKYRATVYEMNPDGTGQRLFAKGLRNVVSIKWIGDSLWATNQGSDHLGAQKPDETFYQLKDGADYGWPYCHSSNGKIFPDPDTDPKVKLRRPSGCKDVTAPYAFFPAHSSAMGFDLFDEADAPSAIKGAFLVSLHGATTKSGTLDTNNRSGYKIAIMRKDQKLQDFLTGFLPKGGGSRTTDALGRPVDIYKLDSNSFLFTDDHKGVIYYVRKKGWKTNIAAETETRSVPETAANTSAPGASPESGRACLPFAAVLVGAVLRLVA